MCDLGILYKKSAAVPIMIELVAIRGFQCINLFDLLGRTLLAISDTTNGQIAFQHELIIQRGMLVYGNISRGPFPVWPLLQYI